MKKRLFSLFSLLLAVAMLVPALPVYAANDLADQSALVGASLYLDDQVDVVFHFDPEVIAAKKAKGKTFSFTLDYNNKTYTEGDLVDMKDEVSGKVYKTITVGPFKAAERNTTFTYSGTMNERNTFSLASLAKSGINYYNALENTTDNQRVLKVLKSFVNYAVAVDNLVKGTDGNLPYNVAVSGTSFEADPGNGTPLNPSSVLTGRNFIFSDDVYIKYEGTTSTSLTGCTVTLNAKDVTDLCNLTISGTNFHFTVPVHADQGMDKLRIIIRDKDGNVVVDCIDRADALAYKLGTDYPEYLHLSTALTGYLQAVSDYSNNPVLEDRTYEAGKYYAGFGRADMTPYCDATELNSPGKDSTEFLEGIYTSCVALRDTKGTVSLVFSMDVRNIQDYSIKGVGVPYTKMKTLAKNAAAEAGFTLTDDQIFFVATHNHNAPSVTSTDETVIAWYNNYFFPSVTEATKKAIQDMAEVEATYTGVGTTGEGTNYNRRYTRYAGTNYVTGYEDERDRELRTIRFARSGAKDILLVNWQAHAANILDAQKGTADFVGTLRSTVEEDLGVHFLYVNGASGDLSMTNQSDLWSNKNIEPDTKNYRTSSGIDYKGVGASIAGTVKGIVGKTEKTVTLGDIETRAISTNNTKNGYTTNGLTTDDGRLYLQHRRHVDGSYCMTLNTYTNTSNIYCQQCYGIYQMIVNAGTYNTKGEYVGVNEKGEAVTYQYYKRGNTTINSTGSTTSGGTTYYRFKAYECEKHFTCAKDQYSQYSSLPVEFSMWTMTMGDDIGFAFAPYEMFNQNGVDLRNEVDGNRMIFTAGYTNGYVGYIASEVAFNKVENDLGGEKGDDGTQEVYATKYKKGCAEYFQTLLSDSLNSQFAN